MFRFSLVTVFGLLFGTTLCFAEEPASTGPKPVPRMQIVPQPHDDDSFERDGATLLCYHRSPNQRRPFWFPINGPTGRSLTRMGHPRDPVSHSHHNSVWISHHSLDEVDFWSDTGEGRIVHQRVEFYEDADDAATEQVVNAWRDGEGRTILQERRRMTVCPKENDEWLLLIDLEFETPDDQAATFGKTPFGLLGVRMAKTIGVHDGGGTIRNSAGGVDEKEVFWKPARWCDYSGPIAPGKSEGITLFDHPQNPNHPTVFHVRNDGWMGASLTYSGARTVEPGKPLRLRYGLYVHRDVPSLDSIEAQWTKFAAIESPATLVPPKKAR